MSKLSDIEITSGGQMITMKEGVLKGLSKFGRSQAPNASMCVYSGCVADGVVIQDYGVMFISNGGVGSNINISSGGGVTVSSGGVCYGVAYQGGGVQIRSKGIFSGTISSGASAYIYAGGVFQGTVEQGGTIVDNN